MGRWCFVVAGGCAVAFATVQISACSLSADGTASATDAMAEVSALDVHVDNSVPDSGSDAQDAQNDTAPMLDSATDARDAEGGIDCQAIGQFFCGTQCVSSCFGCAFGNTQCNSTRVCGTDCTSCAGLPFACYNCGTSPVVGVCQGTKCMGITDCPCVGGDAAACPGTTQICTGGGNPSCKTCGSGMTDHKDCANGKSCVESTGICQ